nr:DUF3265 domain-containing protein [Vibrio sp. B1FLJ16]
MVDFGGKNVITNSSRGIQHAWYFGFKLGLVIKAFKLSVVVARFPP